MKINKQQPKCPDPTYDLTGLTSEQLTDLQSALSFAVSTRVQENRRFFGDARNSPYDPHTEEPIITRWDALYAAIAKAWQK